MSRVNKQLQLPVWLTLKHLQSCSKPAIPLVDRMTQSYTLMKCKFRVSGKLKIKDIAKTQSRNIDLLIILQSQHLIHFGALKSRQVSYIDTIQLFQQIPITCVYISNWIKSMLANICKQKYAIITQCKCNKAHFNVKLKYAYLYIKNISLCIAA